MGFASLAAGCPRPETRPEDAPAEAVAAAAPADCALEDRSGRDRAASLRDLSDPVAAKVLAASVGKGCPTTLPEVHAKLRVSDASGCTSGMFSEVQTVLVSERSQLRRTADGSTEGCGADPIAGFRGVTTRTCGGRESYALSMAVFGLTVETTELPTDVEMIGFDSERGVFNYYSLEQGQWVFHGNSVDMLQGPTEQGLRRCAACHVGGGLVLKELRSPWVFWEGRDTLPGVETILSAHPDLGSRAQGKVLDLRPAGKELEETIEAGNQAWTKTRVEHLATKAPLREALRPMFCSQEIELRAASQTPTTPTAESKVQGTLALSSGELLLDPAMGIDERVTFEVADYHAAIKASGQRLVRACGATLTDNAGSKVVDTVFDLVHPFRSTSDMLVVEGMLERGMLDQDLVRAVLGVDMTRPVFSSERCKLVELIEDLPAKQRTPKAIRESMLATMKSDAARSRPGASELAANLEDPAAVQAKARAFIEACSKRPSTELARDLVRDVSRRRRAARKHPVIELPEMLPVDDYPDTDEGRLDPVTCRWESTR